MGEQTNSETIPTIADNVFENAQKSVNLTREIGASPYDTKNADLPWDQQYQHQKGIFENNHNLDLRYSDEFVNSTKRFFEPNGSLNETATNSLNLKDLTDLTRVSLLAAREQSHPEYSGYNLLTMITALGNRIGALAPSLEAETGLRKAQTDAVRKGIREAYEQCPEQRGIFNTIFTQLAEKLPDAKFYTSSPTETITPVVETLLHFRRITRGTDAEAPPLPPKLAPPIGS